MKLIYRKEVNWRISVEAVLTDKLKKVVISKDFKWRNYTPPPPINFILTDSQTQDWPLQSTFQKIIEDTFMPNGFTGEFLLRFESLMNDFSYYQNMLLEAMKSKYNRDLKIQYYQEKLDSI